MLEIEDNNLLRVLFKEASNGFQFLINPVSVLTMNKIETRVDFDGRILV